MRMRMWLWRRLWLRRLWRLRLRLWLWLRRRFGLR